MGITFSAAGPGRWTVVVGFVGACLVKSFRFFFDDLILNALIDLSMVGVWEQLLRGARKVYGNCGGMGGGGVEGGSVLGVMEVRSRVAMSRVVICECGWR